MSLANPNKIVTEERLSDFYQGILPYLGSSGTEYTAGDGISINNNEISVDEMASADMSEIINPLPPTMSRRMKYSTEEQVIGEWIDGKPIYQKTYSVTSGNDVRIVNNLTNITLLNFFGGFYRNGFYPIGWYYSADRFISCYFDGGSIFCNIASEYEDNLPGYITLQYTKTTD